MQSGVDMGQSGFKGGETGWYALYVKHQHEKKVAVLLERKGIEVLLPLQKVVPADFPELRICPQRSRKQMADAQYTGNFLSCREPGQSLRHPERRDGIDPLSDDFRAANASAFLPGSRRPCSSVRGPASRSDGNPGTFQESVPGHNQCRTPAKSGIRRSGTQQCAART